MKNLSRRLVLLEARAAAAVAGNSFSARLLFVNPVEGLTSVLPLESGKPPTPVPITEEDKEWVRKSLRRGPTCGEPR